MKRLLGASFIASLSFLAGSDAEAQFQRYIYFTCNSTGWGLNDQTRLKAADTIGIDWALEYEVNKDWIVAHGEDCQFQFTNAYNGWGTEHSSHGAFVLGDGVTDHRHYQVSEVGYNQVGRPSYPGRFRASYPGKGTYRLLYTRARAAFTIEKVSTDSAN